jgi:hypothetical protein
MDKNSKQAIWKYETPLKKSVRALSMTPDGKFIGAATFGGDILLFDKKSNNPIQHIKINSSIGAFDLSDDGSIFMTGSADKKVRIYKSGENKTKAEITLNEYVGEVDVSANGKFAVAGTSGAVYFFESLIDLNNFKVYGCNQIIEPPKENTTLSNEQDNINYSPIQADKKTMDNLLFLLMVVSVSCMSLAIIAMVVYVLMSRKRKIKVKKIILIPLGLVIFISFITTVFLFWENEVFQKSEFDEMRNDNQNQSGKNICGDNICDFSFGETKENCPNDCMLLE